MPLSCSENLCPKAQEDAQESRKDFVGLSERKLDRHRMPCLTWRRCAFLGKVFHMRIWVVVALAAAFLVGCSSNETNDKEKRGSTSEETRFVTQLVTVERTVEETTVVSEEPCVTQEQRPEDILALQYEYINSGDFQQACALFAEQSRREVSLAQYRGFFEDNAPYSVTDYSFSPALVRGDSASVYAKFTVTSAAGVERLERSQEFVCERDDWRVVMRAEQVVTFTATDDDADAEPTPEAEKESEPTPQPNVRLNPQHKTESPEPPTPPTATSGGAPPPAGGDCPSEAPIKGNASSSGEFIYHVPGGEYYDRTNAEECFAAESDAQAAGYRASRR